MKKMALLIFVVLMVGMVTISLAKTISIPIPKGMLLAYKYQPCSTVDGKTCGPVIEVYGEKATAEQFTIRNKNASPYSIPILYKYPTRDAEIFISHLMWAVDEAEKRGFMPYYIVVK